MQTSRFVITREDLNVDPVTLVTDALKIGRLPGCELVLNHPSVSRLHAGFNEAGGHPYVFNFSRSSGTTLNGRVLPVSEAEVLADGDRLQIGPFVLDIRRLADGALGITVSLQVALNAGEAEVRGEQQQQQQQSRSAGRPPSPEAGTKGDTAPDRAAPKELADTLNVFWEKRKRETGKMQRLSPLRPRAPARVLGKARFNWVPTRDLTPVWSPSVFVWAGAVVGLLSLVAAFGYAQTFSPAPLSGAHARGTIQSQPPTAARPNAGSCTTCHTLGARMETNCAGCHRAEGFTASITQAHADAGITCADCHGEHRGAEFQPALMGLAACTECHAGANRKLYRGRSVGTPHGGTFGYPVAAGRWVWRGLDDEEWSHKSPGAREALGRVRESAGRRPAGAADSPDQQRSAQFHALHLHRVRAAAGLRGNREGEMTCSSCHQSFSPIDRETPRATCGACHDGDPGGRFQQILTADSPNCISCHVQHPRGRRAWGSSLLAGAGAANRPAAGAAGNSAGRGIDSGPLSGGDAGPKP